MKTIYALCLITLLLGCASTDYSAYELSSASITNLKYSESINLRQGKHKILLSFDYTIDNFHAESGLYHCSVQFKMKNNMTMTKHKGWSLPCQIDQASGHLSLIWPTPLDSSLKSSKQNLALMNYPIEFFVAIHQATGKRQSNIIGSSDTQKSKV